MNKILPIFAFLSLVAAIGVLFFFSRSQTINPENSQTLPMNTNETNKSTITSLQEILNQAQPQQCTFSYSDPETGESVSGITYIADEKIRTNFEGTYEDGLRYTGGMIIDGISMYTWSSEMDEGVKIAVTRPTREMIADATSGQNEINPLIDLTQDTEYVCTEWNPDEDMFSPPVNIEFIDYSSEMRLLEEFRGASEDDALAYPR